MIDRLRAESHIGWGAPHAEVYETAPAEQERA
jgi:cytochrome c oxidase subunit 1